MRLDMMDDDCDIEGFPLVDDTVHQLIDVNGKVWFKGREIDCESRQIELMYEMDPADYDRFEFDIKETI